MRETRGRRPAACYCEGARRGTPSQHHKTPKILGDPRHRDRNRRIRKRSRRNKKEHESNKGGESGTNIRTLPRGNRSPSCQAISPNKKKQKDLRPNGRGEPKSIDTHRTHIRTIPLAVSMRQAGNPKKYPPPHNAAKQKTNQRRGCRNKNTSGATQGQIQRTFARKGRKKNPLLMAPLYNSPRKSNLHEDAQKRGKSQKQQAKISRIFNRRKRRKKNQTRPETPRPRTGKTGKDELTIRSQNQHLPHQHHERYILSAIRTGSEKRIIPRACKSVAAPQNKRSAPCPENTNHETRVLPTPNLGDLTISVIPTGGRTWQPSTRTSDRRCSATR